MITTLNREDIRKTDPHRHKFGSAMAEYLYDLSMVGGEDELTGDVEAPTGHVCRFGKWLLFNDSQGFVDGIKYETEDIAHEAFNGLAERYDQWADEGEP